MFQAFVDELMSSFRLIASHFCGRKSKIILVHAGTPEVMDVWESLCAACTVRAVHAVRAECAMCAVRAERAVGAMCAVHAERAVGAVRAVGAERAVRAMCAVCAERAAGAVGAERAVHAMCAVRAVRAASGLRQDIAVLKQQNLGQNVSDLCDSDSAENCLSLRLTCMGVAAEYNCQQFSLIVIQFLQICPT